MVLHDTKSIWYWFVHASLIGAVVYARFDSAVVSVAVLVAIFSNLGQRSASSMSAYSIFNRGFKHLLGDLQPDALDKQLRGGGAAASNVDQSNVESSGNRMTNFPSKYINRPCPCGSGLKAKKCCASSQRPRNTNQPSGRTKQDDSEYDFSQFEVLEQ